jgi:histidyl-tRNA synthetase
MTPVQPVRGTQSLLGEDADRLAAVAAAFDRVRRLYGFKRVEVPTIEHTQVFARTIGETTDVVSKEMYSFDDRGGESITLRPEFTAGICRAYLSEGWQQHAPLKVAAQGSAFRYERPQKGRFREFHQLDAEIIGAAEPQADVELLSLGHQLLVELGIAEGVTLELNTLGDPDTREAWRTSLIDYFEGHKAGLSEDSVERLRRNPLRILDSKDPRDRSICEGAPGIDEHLTAQASDFFAAVTAGIDAAGVPWKRNARLVRGLDYYRHTAFEFVTDRLGAQGTVIAGGRYDGLVEALGGPHTPAVGWAAGIERLAMMIGAPEPEVPQVALVDDSGRSVEDLVLIATVLRKADISVALPFARKPKRQFELAVKSGAAVRLSIRRWEPNEELSVEQLQADDPVIVQIRYGIEHEINPVLSQAIFSALSVAYQTTKPAGSDGLVLLRERSE